MNRAQATELVRSSGLAPHAKGILSKLRDSVRLRREQADIAALPIGASRFGGPPDLPSDFTWPTWTVERGGGFRQFVEKDRMRLDFLAQINLAELPDRVPKECPRQGMLYFFYDTYEQPWQVAPGLPGDGGAQVIFVAEPGQLVRTNPPPERGEHTTPPFRLRLEAAVTLPYSHAPRVDDVHQREYRDKIARPINEQQVVHRMFGHPQPVQGEREIWRSTKDVLLLQLDSDKSGDRSPGWMWCDLGRLYFTISKEALARRAFDEVRMTLQCY